MHGSQERNFSCHICGNKFRDEKQCKKHLELHSGKKYKCEYCGKEFASNTYLSRHRNIHEGKYSGHCDFCDKNFVQFSNYRLHMMKHHQMKVKAPARS